MQCSSAKKPLLNGSDGRTQSMEQSSQFSHNYCLLAIILLAILFGFIFKFSNLVYNLHIFKYNICIN